MLNYKGIEALHAVIQWRHFESAANKLCITQSAVTQRIKTLEKYYGEPLLVRSSPPKPTPLGEQLIAHYKRVLILEDSLNTEHSNNKPKGTLSIALNRDSLETWFLKNLQQIDIMDNITLNIIADDQEKTLAYLRQGMVSACLATSKTPITGGVAHYLGDMAYHLVCSPDYAQRYFYSRKQSEWFRDSVALQFDNNDHLHQKYLDKYFSNHDVEINYHVIPSVYGFKSYALQGYGYGLIPKIDIEPELQNKTLIDLLPNQTWRIPLYWHHWELESEIYQQFNRSLIQEARKSLIYHQN